MNNTNTNPNTTPRISSMLDIVSDLNKTTDRLTDTLLLIAEMQVLDVSDMMSNIVTTSTRPRNTEHQRAVLLDIVNAYGELVDRRDNLLDILDDNDTGEMFVIKDSVYHMLDEANIALIGLIGSYLKDEPEPSSFKEEMLAVLRKTLHPRYYDIHDNLINE